MSNVISGIAVTDWQIFARQLEDIVCFALANSPMIIVKS
jgi:hypothetical protein